MMTLSDTVAVGQIWNAHDHKTIRHVRVETIVDDHYVMVRTVVRDGNGWKSTGVLRRVQRHRFNGRIRSGGYGLEDRGAS